MSFLEQWLIIWARNAFPGRYVPEVQAFKEAYAPEYAEARAYKARAAKHTPRETSSGPPA